MMCKQVEPSLIVVLALQEQEQAVESVGTA